MVQQTTFLEVRSHSRRRRKNESFGERGSVSVGLKAQYLQVGIFSKSSSGKVTN